VKWLLRHTDNPKYIAIKGLIIDSIQLGEEQTPHVLGNELTDRPFGILSSVPQRAISHGLKYSSTDVHISLEQTEMTREGFNGRRLGDANGAG
jgi:hypothetical protein